MFSRLAGEQVPFRSSLLQHGSRPSESSHTTSLQFLQYKWKKPDKDATLLHVCSANSDRSLTCARLYEAGVAALVENLFIFFAALIMFISGRSSGEWCIAQLARSRLMRRRRITRY